MRHHAEDIAPFVDDAGNVVQRSVRIRLGSGFAFLIDVTKDHLPVPLDAVQRFRIGIVIACLLYTSDAADE